MSVIRGFRRFATLPLTAERYPRFRRDARYAQLTDSDVVYFRSILPETSVSTSEEVLANYNKDWLNHYRGQSKLALRPQTTLQVSQILAYCNQRSLAVVPQGGNTGVVGGSVPVFDEIVLSSDKLKNIETFDNVSGILICQAGCVLQQLDEYVAKQGYLMPLDLGAKGSCHIGGNIATNAGGLRLLRYGSLRANVLGLEVVLPDGTIIDNLTTLRKDNTGFDLKQLFIGSEGTLGFVTKVAILTPQRPKAVNVAFISCSSYERSLKIFQKAKVDLGEILSAFELMDNEAWSYGRDHVQLEHLFKKQHQFNILLETSGSDNEHDIEKLTQFLSSCEDLMEDCLLSQSESQTQRLWRVREAIPTAVMSAGFWLMYDVTLPLEHYYTMVEKIRERVAGTEALVFGFGHMGDGNLHLNVVTREFDQRVLDLVEPYVYELTAKWRGSMSAEHGLGIMKSPYLGYAKDAYAIDQMRRIKAMFDPRGILNPYKYLPLK